MLPKTLPKITSSFDLHSTTTAATTILAEKCRPLDLSSNMVSYCVILEAQICPKREQSIFFATSSIAG